MYIYCKIILFQQKYKATGNTLDNDESKTTDMQLFSFHSHFALVCAVVVVMVMVVVIAAVYGWHTKT